jgi:type VI secretion system protein VasG
VLSRCTEVDSGARNVDNILNGTLLPEVAETVLSRMAEGKTFERLKMSATTTGQFAGQFQYDFT